MEIEAVTCFSNMAFNRSLQVAISTLFVLIPARKINQMSKLAPEIYQQDAFLNTPHVPSPKSRDESVAEI
jgi:hypothetical protein